MLTAIPYERWQSGCVQGGEVVEIRWLAIPLLERELGITESGQWVYSFGNGLLPITAAHDLAHLFHFLERSEMEFQGLLRMSLLTMGLSMETVDTFPCDLLVSGAIGSRNTYWSSRALNWLEEGMPMTIAIAEALDEFVSAKHGTQRDRHRAFQLYRQWRNAVARNLLRAADH